MSVQSLLSEIVLPEPQGGLLASLEFLRLEATRGLETHRKAQLGQFLTPLPVASFMAKLLESNDSTIRLLDPGAGAGTLFATCVLELCSRPTPPAEINVTAYEIDNYFLPYLDQTVKLCRDHCRIKGVIFNAEIIQADFIKSVVEELTGNLFAPAALTNRSYNCVILNPPYRKIQTSSVTRKQLRQVGIEGSNLYVGFLALSTLLTQKGAEMVAITPRSFCNGLYFKPFRKFLLDSHKMTFKRIHLFESRGLIFQEDAVLQENLIFRVIKGVAKPDTVLVSMGNNLISSNLLTYPVSYNQVIHPDDLECFIHIPDSDATQLIPQKLKFLKTSLNELNLQVSTGRVVEFRTKEFLRHSIEPGDKTVPLLHPTNLKAGFITWPNPANSNGKKRPVAIQLTAQTRKLLVPNELYVLVKRFTTKEESRRLIAAIYDPCQIPENIEVVGFENHLNYFHQKGRGLPRNLALGLVAFLNSSWLDNYFRQFNGHTQVNASDLRNIRYPTRYQLETLGNKIGQTQHQQFPDQSEIDRLVATLLEE